jgi:hypothetical protein
VVVCRRHDPGHDGLSVACCCVSALIPVACLLIVAAVLWWTIKRTGPTVVNDRQPQPVDRLAAWEIRLGAYRARERIRQESARIAFDERATVQPKINPRLPK